jgi:Mn2+/Fe2+ NRAMP family transporter
MVNDRLSGLALGILTAVGGFVDVGGLVTSSVTGARFGMSLAWVIVVGVVGICLYANMSGRVAAISGRATFEVIRERLGARAGLANLIASTITSVMTLTAEIGGIALGLQLASSVHRLLWVPIAAFGVWLVIWRVKFTIMENISALLGLALIIFAVALFLLNPDWNSLAGQLVNPNVTGNENPGTYWYFAIALFGSAMTPYEVFFFSSGAREEKWTAKDLSQARVNLLIGFPLGGLISIFITAGTAVVLLPFAINVTSMAQVVLPVVIAGGKVFIAIALLGIVAVTFGAALESTLSSGYSVAQFFGWSWGKFRRPAEAARFHLAIILCLIIGLGILLIGVDPIQLTEYSMVFSAIALPLTYLPILVVANDPEYMGKHVNGRATNVLGIIFLVIVLVASLAAIPIMIITGAGA